MDSPLKNVKNSRKKISRRKKLVHSKSYVDKTAVKDVESSSKGTKKGEQRQKRKKFGNMLTTSLTTCSKISSNADTENISCVSEKDALLSLKAKRKAKVFKQKLINKKKVNVANKSSDLETLKNITKKRKRSHIDSEYALVKEEKQAKSKKNRVHSKRLRGSISSDNSKSNNTDKLPQETRLEVSDYSNSDEDEEIRKELKKSSFFKNIQKLLKDNPFPLSSVDISEEEHSETDPAKHLKQSDLEEECLDDASCDDTHEEFKKKPEELSTPVSYKHETKCLSKIQNDKKKNEKKCGDKSQNSIKASHDEIAMTTISVRDFNRTQRRNLTNRDDTLILKKETSSLRNKALEKLQGAKFRYLNEKLYTESGKDSFNYFQQHKDEYMDYHKGYSLQVAKWPLNPVDKIITSLQQMKKEIVIADMGCGDAKIAQALSKCTVHSFDLVALNDFVTACNISKVPLPNESVDVVVFCLSLMGINLKEYLQEAYRIAKLGGILKIAEVESRIPSLEKFIKSIEALGFSLEKKDLAHKLFVFLEFRKTMKKKKNASVQNITLNPCLYKKR